MRGVGFFSPARFALRVFLFLKDNFMTASILRRPAVEAIVGLGRSAIYNMMAKGLFPKPVKLTAKAVGWRKADIDAWLASREVA